MIKISYVSSNELFKFKIMDWSVDWNDRKLKVSFKVLIKFIISDLAYELEWNNTILCEKFPEES